MEIQETLLAWSGKNRVGERERESHQFVRFAALPVEEVVRCPTLLCFFPTLVLRYQTICARAAAGRRSASQTCFFLVQ
jgi:hypothetical protein